MPIVLFDTESVYRDSITNPVFQAGHAYQMNDDFAGRWVRRGVAKIVKDYRGKITPDPRSVQVVTSQFVPEPEPLVTEAPAVTEAPVEPVATPAPAPIRRGRWSAKR